MSDNPYLPDDYEPADTPADIQPESAGRPGCLRPDRITVVFLILTGVFLVYFVTLLVDPYLPINPFPPRTPLPIYVVATADPNRPTNTPMPTKVPETPRLNTIMPTATPLPQATRTPPPTDTPVIMAPPSFPTATRIPPTPTLIRGAEQSSGITGILTPPPPVDPAQVTRSPFPFTADYDMAAAIANPNDQGCRWASIAGTVIDLEGRPVSGLAVHVVGEGIDEIRFTGTALTYGAGGYEIFLNGAPLSGQYVIQLLSQTGAPVSEQFTVETSPRCEENVAIVNFIQNHAY
jgi:hypothetical protein